VATIRLIDGAGVRVASEYGGEEASVPYRRIWELPESIRQMYSIAAQQTYLEAYNAAWQEWDSAGSREQSAHRAAMSLLRHRRTRR
jgi:cation transport regulator ChaB